MISRDHVGRSYPPTQAYLVTRERIEAFAAALRDGNPAYAGDDAIAPPTFVMMISAAAWAAMFDDPGLGLSLSRTVHIEQRFAWARPLRAGDEVTAALSITGVRVRNQLEMITIAVEVDTVAGEHVCTATSNLYHTREEAA